MDCGFDNGHSELVNMETKVQNNSTLSVCLFIFSSTTCFLYSLFLHAAYLQWEYLCLSAGCEELSAVKTVKIDINYSAKVPHFFMFC